MRNFLAILVALLLVSMTSCLSVDPLPGFHFDSNVVVTPPAVVEAESHLSADVLALGCYLLAFATVADDVPLCAPYLPAPAPAEVPAEPLPGQPAALRSVPQHPAVLDQIPAEYQGIRAGPFGDQLDPREVTVTIARGAW